MRAGATVIIENSGKWNKIEHRLFSFISMNWKGHPLTDYETVVSLIAATKTEKGLTVTSQLDEQIYKKGIQITEEQMNGLNLKKNQFHGEWNYSIKNKNVLLNFGQSLNTCRNWGMKTGAIWKFAIRPKVN
jgi:hypothetical protein